MSTQIETQVTSEETLNGILVCMVEDDHAIAKIYQHWLKIAGAQVILFKNFESFQDFIRNLQRSLISSPTDKKIPDLIITDLMLPDGSGAQVLQLWKKQFPYSPVLILTAFATIENAVDLMKSGAFDFMRKPLQPEELIIAVRRAWEHGTLIKENVTLSKAVRIFSMSQALSIITEKNTLLITTCRIILREINGRAGYIFLYNQSKKEIDILFESNTNKSTKNNAQDIKDKYIHQLVSGSTIKETSERKDFSISSHFFIHHLNKDIIAIEFYSKNGNNAFVAFTLGSQSYLISDKHNDYHPILLQAANSYQALDNAEHIANLSYIDDLTGYYNQRFMQLAMDNEIARANRYGTQFSVLFFDCDGFKNINDTYGHLVGSQLLQEIAKLCRKILRDSDILIRYGGDEFIAILTNTNIPGAITVATRLQEKIDNTRFDLRTSTHVNSAWDLHMTVSVGISGFPESATKTSELIRFADMAMYAAKHKGKNQVCTYNSDNKDVIKA